MGAPCEATMTLPLRQGLAFNKARVQGGAGGQYGPRLRQRLRSTNDHFAVHLHDTPMVSRLHALGIQQPGWRHARWCGRAASMPLAWRLMPPAVGMQHRLARLGALIAGEAWHGGIGDVQAPIEQPISALWRPLTNPEGHHEPPPRGKGHPDPCIPIRLIGEPSTR
jgi:hypothetical protein